MLMFDRTKVGALLRRPIAKIALILLGVVILIWLPLRLTGYTAIWNYERSARSLKKELALSETGPITTKRHCDWDSPRHVGDVLPTYSCFIRGNFIAKLPKSQANKLPGYFEQISQQGWKSRSTVGASYKTVSTQGFQRNKNVVDGLSASNDLSIVDEALYFRKGRTNLDVKILARSSAYELQYSATLESNIPYIPQSQISLPEEDELLLVFHYEEFYFGD